MLEIASGCSLPEAHAWHTQATPSASGGRSASTARATLVVKHQQVDAPATMPHLLSCAQRGQRDGSTSAAVMALALAEAVQAARPRPFS